MKTTVEDSTNRSLPVTLGLLGTIGLSLVLAVFLSLPQSEARAQTDPGATLFAQNCASCHQADGAGIPGTFPPLTGNPTSADPTYVAEVIQNGRSGPLDVDGVSYDSVMPAVAGLEGADLDALVAYVVTLAEGSAVADEPDPEATEPDGDEEAAPIVGSADRGRSYFLGSRRLDEGGAACASCHTAGAEGNLGGPGLGPDLSTVFQSLGGEAGLTGWLTNPPSPTMAPIFSGNPMTEPEIADLVAYFESTPDVERSDPAVDGLTLAGLAGLMVLFGGMSIGWRGMRQTYVERLRSQR